nr:hypothetical protein [Tanacetum cinerariifolium]
MAFLSSPSSTNEVDATIIQVSVASTPVSTGVQKSKIQESRPRNQDNLRKTVIVEDTSSKAMVAIDGVGFD